MLTPFQKTICSKNLTFLTFFTSPAMSYHQLSPTWHHVHQNISYGFFRKELLRPCGQTRITSCELHSKSKVCTTTLRCMLKSIVQKWSTQNSSKDLRVAKSQRVSHTYGGKVNFTPLCVPRSLIASLEILWSVYSKWKKHLQKNSSPKISGWGKSFCRALLTK